MNRLIGKIIGPISVVIGAGSVLAFIAIGAYDLPFWRSVFWHTFALAVASLSTSLYQLSKRLTASTAEEVRATDTRRPILLLRNFGDDVLTLSRSWSFSGHFANEVRGRNVTLEELIAERLKQFGPVLAVTRPGEELPPYGFARMRLLNDSQWRDEVIKLICESQLIVFILGETTNAEDGLGWEVATVVANAPPEKVVIAVPPVDDAIVYWARFRELSGGRFNGIISRRDCLLTFSDAWKIFPLGAGDRREMDYRESLDKLIRTKRALLSREECWLPSIEPTPHSTRLSKSIDSWLCRRDVQRRHEYSGRLAGLLFGFREG